MVSWPWRNHCLASLTLVLFTNSSCPFKVVVGDVPNAWVGVIVSFLLNGLGCSSFGVVVDALLGLFNLGSQRDVLQCILIVEDVVDEGALPFESPDNAGETEDIRLNSLHS